MPIPGVKYRFKSLGHNKKLRLAFKGKKVVEIVDFHKRGGVYKRHRMIYKARKK